MEVFLLYFIIIVLSNTVGAISGMGGGVIIKPVLDTFGFHSLAAISFYSSVAVFTMSISSTYKQIKNGVKINWLQSLFISIGSVIGGIVGNKLFVYLLDFYGSQREVQLIQIVLTVISLILVLVYTLTESKTLHLKHPVVYLLVGFFLGGFSTLLGIGGGPINVSLLVFCFGLTMKDATVYSIITIFFSQLARLAEVGLSSGFGVYDLTILLAIIPAALIGGYLGGVVSGKVSDKVVSKIFVWIVILVIVINILNGIKIV